MVGVHWREDGWFEAGENGAVYSEMDIPGIKAVQKRDGIYDVSLDTLGEGDPRWCYMRDYDESRYEFGDHSITLTGSEVTLEEEDIPTFLGIRQSEFETELLVALKTDAKEAGITCYMDESQHYDVAIFREEDGVKAKLRLRTGDAIGIAGEVTLPQDLSEYHLRIVSEHEWYHFYCGQGTDAAYLGKARAKYLSTEVAGGFTGVLLAMYVIDETGKKAEFTEFTWTQKGH